jgi:hypothetical protein
MSLNIGQKLTIRKDLVHGQIYGVETFVDYMSKFKGKKVVVSQLVGKCFCIEGDKENWKFTTEMTVELSKNN